MTALPGRICVVGSAMTDLVARVTRHPQIGETLVGSGFHQGFGGKGSNQAVTAVRLGAHVTMVVKLGRDAYGEATLANYRDNGIVTDHILFDDERPSGIALITVDDAGRNSIVIIPGANDALSADDVAQAKAAIEAAQLVICQCETPVEASIAAFRLARAAKVTTILNPAPARELPPELLALTDIIAPNETETTLLTGIAVESLEQAKQAAVQLQRRGVATVVITLGERGALLCDAEGALHVSSPVVKAVDTTGAGDAFIGCLAYELARGQTLRQAVPRATAIAALSVTTVGAQTSFPTRAAADAFLREHGL